VYENPQLFFFNLDVPELAKANVRKAITLATDLAPHLSAVLARPTSAMPATHPPNSLRALGRRCGRRTWLERALRPEAHDRQATAQDANISSSFNLTMLVQTTPSLVSMSSLADQTGRASAWRLPLRRLNGRYPDYQDHHQGFRFLQETASSMTATGPVPGHLQDGRQPEHPHYSPAVDKLMTAVPGTDVAKRKAICQAIEKQLLRTTCHSQGTSVRRSHLSLRHELSPPAGHVLLGPQYESVWLNK